MLPKGVKSLAEIDKLGGTVDRARELGFLLEYILKRITPNGRRLKFIELISVNRERFPNFAKLDSAREARNAIVHGERVTERAILQAEAEFQSAIETVVAICPAEVQFDVRGIPLANMRQEQPSDDPVPPLLPPVAPPTPSPLAPLSDSTRALPPTFWFVLAAGCVFVAVFIHLVQPHSEHAQAISPLTTTIPSHSEAATSVTQEAKSRRDAPSPQVVDDPPVPNRDSQFRGLINMNLSVSSAQPNLALLIDSSGPTTPGSVTDSLSGFLNGANVRIIANLADPGVLKEQGFFDDLYAGNVRFLSEAAQLSRVDYILLAKATYSFRRQPDLDPVLTTCDLSLTSRLADRTGTVVRSESFSVSGPGFTPALALERASENAARQLKEKILDAVR